MIVTSLLLLVLVLLLLLVLVIVILLLEAVGVTRVQVQSTLFRVGIQIRTTVCGMEEDGGNQEGKGREEEGREGMKEREGREEMEGRDDWEYRPEYSPETAALLSAEFPQLRGQTYLDHAGATLYSRSQVEDLSCHLLSSLHSNPHSSLAGAELVAEARSSLLAFLGPGAAEHYTVVFTAGATAAIKLVGEVYPWGPGGLVLHEESHTSAVGLRELALAGGAGVRVEDDGGVEEWLAGDDLEGALLCYPAMSNYNGRKLPGAWVARAQGRGARVLLDTAAWLATNPLDLAVISPDFLVMSFYKMFGLPTGLGALVLRTSLAPELSKRYFGGGSVDMYLLRENIQVARQELAARLEDGTVHYLGIAALAPGLRALARVPGGMAAVARHTHGLARLAYTRLTGLRHHNGRGVVRVHCEGDYGALARQGGMLNFSLLDGEGGLVGHNTVARLADMEGVVLRWGHWTDRILLE